MGIISQTDYGYTGQRDLASGMGELMDYKARFYSPYLNRFIQPDTLIPDPVNSQAWNRYAYVYGNPVRHTDPSGHLICLDGEQCYSGSLPGAPSWSQGGGWIGSGNHGGDDEEEEESPNIPTCGYRSCEVEMNLYELGWENFGQAWNIWTNPNASYGQRWLAGTYMSYWGGAHAMFIAGSATLSLVYLAEFIGFGAPALSADGDPTNEVRAMVKFDPIQVQAKFKHAIDFGVGGNYSAENASRFVEAMKLHINNNGTQMINGTYRSVVQTINYFNPNTGLNVITDLENNFISGWRLGASQMNYLITTGNLK